MGCPVVWQLLGGRMLPGGTRGPESAQGRGMKEVVTRVTAPEPGWLPRAAGSCAGWSWHGGGAGAWGGVGVRPPQLCPSLPCIRDWGGGPILGCRWGPLGWRPPEIVTCVSCTLRRGMALPGPLQGILGGTRLGAPTHVGTAPWSNNPPPNPIPPLQGGWGGGNREGCRDGAHTPRTVPALLLGSYL